MLSFQLLAYANNNTYGAARQDKRKTPAIKSSQGVKMAALRTLGQKIR